MVGKKKMEEDKHLNLEPQAADNLEYKCEQQQASTRQDTNRVLVLVLVQVLVLEQY